MKYIKSFESLHNEKSYNEICDDLSDICLELQDVGFIIRFTSMYKNGSTTASNYYGLSISISKSQFELSEIKETILRIVDYMKIEGHYNSSWMINPRHTIGYGKGHTNLKGINKINYKISGIRLEFEKKKKTIFSNFLKRHR